MKKIRKSGKTEKKVVRKIKGASTYKMANIKNGSLDKPLVDASR